jgi:uncharacterized tellurite resistance protein B-like protein
MMFERFTALLDRLAGHEVSEDKITPLQLAAASLMFAVMDADGYRHTAELAALEKALSGQFDLEGQALQDLVWQGEAAEAEAVDLYQFTSVLVKLPEEERLHLLELLFEVVYSDGELHELEDNLVWRIAELMGISTRERVELRQKVAEKRRAS